MGWRESEHPRDSAGQFRDKNGQQDWAARVNDEISRTLGYNPEDGYEPNPETEVIPQGFVTQGRFVKLPLSRAEVGDQITDPMNGATWTIRVIEFDSTGQWLKRLSAGALELSFMPASHEYFIKKAKPKPEIVAGAN